MHHFHSLALVLAVFTLNLISSVTAGLYVVNPFSKSFCKAGQDCVITWLDDGEQPLLSDVGVCTLGLYHGKQKLVQTLQPVDVSKTRSVTFKPNAEAGPDSDGYYVSFISTSFKVKANGSTSDLPYASFSPFFSLEGMSGSFDDPLPEATSTRPIPSSLANSGSQPTKPLSTITVGKLNTSLPPLPSQTLLSIPASSTASGFVTSPSSEHSATTPISTSSSTSSVAPSPTSNGAHDRSASGVLHLFALFSLAPIVALL